LEKVKAPNNEINGLMDALCDMIDRTPAATPEVLLPRSRRNLAVEMDEDDMDFPEALRLLQAPQLQGAEQLPFKNLSYKTYKFSFRAAVPAPEGEDLLRITSSEMAPTSPPGGVLRNTSIPLRWAWA
jgi:hypothetical protein